MRGITRKAVLILAVFLLGMFTYVSADEIKTDSGEETHKVVKGDTLWNISGDFYKNPFLWPILWSRNPKITNPHLIYPEDMINLMQSEAPKKRIIEKVIIKKIVKEVPVIEIVEIEEEPKSVEAPPPPPPEPEPVIADLVENRTLESSGYFTLDYPEGRALIQGGFEGMMLMAKDSLVYIDKGIDDGIKEGEEFTVISALRVPESEDAPLSGYIAKISGRLVIEEVISESQSIARITEHYSEIERGNILIPVFKVDENAKLNNDVPEVEGLKVIAAKEGVQITGGRSIVYLNKGADDGLKAGHRFGVFREKYLGPHARTKDIKTRFPEEKAGELVVLYTTTNTATAVISPSEQKDISINDTDIRITNRAQKDKGNVWKR